MELNEYPRPANDSGRGVHWFPTLGQRRSVIDENVARLVDLKVRWLVLWNGLDEPALLVNDYLIKRLVAADITPVMHVYVRPIAPLDDAALTRLHRLVAFYRDPLRRVDYFQLFYEPNVAGEWEGERLPEDPVARYLDAWLPAAQEVVHAGGLPGLAPLWPGGDYDDLRFLAESLEGIIARDQGPALDRAWVALHSYNLGHGLGTAEDGVGYYRYVPVNDIVTSRLGRPLPLLTTEGGTRAGPPPYGDGATEAEVAADTAAAFEAMHSAPEAYFCYAPWLFGNALGGGDDPGWEPMAWFGGDGTARPVVTAVGGAAAASRPGGAPAAVAGARERVFEETGYRVRGAFLDMFTRYGLDLCGLPLGEATLENGLPTQYFQRVVMEEYWPGRVRLRPAGEELVDAHVQVVQMKGQVEPLQEEAARLREALTDAKRTTRGGRAADAAAQAELAAARTRLSDLEAENARLESLAALAVPAQAAGGGGDVVALAAAEMYKLQTRVAELEKALDVADSQRKQADEDSAVARAQLNDLQGRIVSGDVMAVVSREALDVAELVRDQEARLAELGEAVSRLESEKALADEELTGLKGEVGRLRARASKAESERAAAREDAQRLGQERQELEKRAADLETRLSAAEEAAAAMPAIHDLQDRIAQLEAALADSQAAVQEMLADKPRISQVLDKWKAAQVSLGAEAETVRLQARVQDLERSLAEAQRQAGEPVEAEDAAAGKAAAVEPETQDLQARVAELDAFIGKAQAELRHLREENRQLAGHVAELEAAGARKK